MCPELDIDFSGPLELSSQDWKTAPEWVRAGRAVKYDAKGFKGQYHKSDTVPLVDPLENEEWLKSGLPF